MNMRRSSKLDSDIDEESLILFRELHHRANMSLLLQPVSTEFESDDIGKNAAYGIGSGLTKKKSLGHEFLAETSKNDYDWLKTPPATPLFPSLEMEAIGNARNLVVQRELPITQPLSRFAENLKGSGGETKYYCNWKAPNSTTKPKVGPAPMHQRPSFDPIKSERKPKPMAPTVNNQIPIQSTTTTSKKESRAKPISRGLSPSPRVRSTTKVPTLDSRGAPGKGLFSNLNETPPNLKKSDDRPSSRGRSSGPASNLVLKPSMESQSLASANKARRQSCSPSIARGRNQASQVATTPTASDVQKGKLVQGATVLGSSIVDKMMKARRIAASDQRPNGRSEVKLNKAIKNMEIRTDRVPGTAGSRSTSRPRSSCGSHF